MKKTIFLFCLLSIITSSMLGQNKKYIDSLILLVKTMPNDTIKVGNYGTLHEKLMFSNPELALDYAKKSLELAKKLSYTKGMAGGNLHIGNYYYNKNQIDSAKYYYNKSLKLSKSLSYALGLIFVNHSLASIEKDLGNYDKAAEIVMRNINLYDKNNNLTTLHDKTPFNLIGAEYELLGQIYLLKGNLNIALKKTLQALRFFEKTKDEIRQADALNQLGSIEHLLEHFESSISYSKQAFAIYKKFDDKFYQPLAANNIGRSYTKLLNFKEAKKYFNKALQLATEIEAINEQAKAIEGLGKIFFEEQNYKEAKKKFQLALNKYKIIDFKNEIAIALSLLSKVEFANKNWKLSLDYLNQSIVINKHIGTNLNLSEDYLSRSKIYERLNHTQLALLDLKQHKIMNDSIFNNIKSRQIEELRTIYETEKKEQQILIQKNEIDLLNIKGKMNNLQRLLLGFGLVLALLSIYALYQKTKRNKIEKKAIKTDLEFKTKELTTHALHLAKKNEVLNDLKQKAKILKESSSDSNGYQMLIRTINFDLQDDNNWENFSKYFEEIHKDFNFKAQQQYPKITSNDLRLMALLKMNLTSKEIANILNISNDGIKKARQRLRKKMGIDSNYSLEALVITI